MHIVVVLFLLQWRMRRFLRTRCAVPPAASSRFQATGGNDGGAQGQGAPAGAEGDSDEYRGAWRLGKGPNKQEMIDMFGQETPTGRKIDDPDEHPGHAVAADIASSVGSAQRRGGATFGDGEASAVAARAESRAVDAKQEDDRRRAAEQKAARTVAKQPPGPPPLAGLYGRPAAKEEPKDPPLTPQEQLRWKVKLGALAAFFFGAPYALESLTPTEAKERPRRRT